MKSERNDKSGRAIAPGCTLSRMKTMLQLCFAASLGCSLFAQTASNPLVSSEKGLYDFLVANVVHAAEKMPEENYSFKPTPEVRSFGQIAAHAADANFMFCSIAIGEKNPSPGVEKTKTSKADIVQGLNDAVAYCNKAFDGLTDAKAAEMVKLFGHDLTRLSVMSLNSAHADEHYGNMVTYMRIKGLVPPSSEHNK